MPAKTVRFAEINEVYSLPSTPSPTFSTLTLSTSGPITPPTIGSTPLPHHPSLFTYKPFLDGGASSEMISIHQVLAMTTKPKFDFDLSNLPDRTIRPQPPVLSPRVLAEAATVPPTASFTIICEHLPWEIRIRPASSKPDAFVTVSDVLNGLYSGLRFTVRETEYMSETPASQARISEAFVRRCNRPEALAKGEMNHGLRRIDFMPADHRFLGFSPVGPLVWKLHVSR